MADRDMNKSKVMSVGGVNPAEQLAAKFSSASQADRIADPKLNNAAKVVAISYAHIDAAFKPGSSKNLKAKTMLIDVMAAKIAKGRMYDKPHPAGRMKSRYRTKAGKKPRSVSARGPYWAGAAALLFQLVAVAVRVSAPLDKFQDHARLAFRSWAAL